MPARNKDTYSIQAVEHALDLLEVLCEEEGEVRISRLSDRLGMNKTSVFRLLATFENRGYVEQDASGKYSLGLAAYEIGQKFLSRMHLLRKARPVMAKLVFQCHEAVYLVVRRDTDTLFLDMVDHAQQVKIVSLVNRRFPLPATAAGKVFLAFDSATRAVPADLTLPADSVTIPREELAAIRRQGTSTDRHGAGDGIACLATPVFDNQGALAGTLAMLGPEFRMPQQKIDEEFLPRLKEAGEIISSKLGFIGNYLSQPRL